MALLEVEGLHVGYGFPVLMGISFEVQEGERRCSSGSTAPARPPPSPPSPGC